MRWALLVLAACVPPPPQHPPGVEVTTCHLAPLYEGTISWKAHGTELVCTSNNDSGDPREICYQPVVGVRETGAVYTSHGPVCSDELAEGASQALSVKLDMPRELCQMDRGGCVVHAFAIDWPKSAESAPVVTLARSLEATARQPGRDRPTVAECNALADRLEVGSRDDMIAVCLVQSRATLACMQGAPDVSAVAHCAP
jgi:hypothetical protein